MKCLMFGSMTLCAFLVSCGGTQDKSEDNQTPVPAPSNLVASFDQAQRTVSLQWTPSSSPVNGYYLEGYGNDGVFGRIGGCLTEPSSSFTFMETPPEVLVMHFRVQATLNGRTSAYSNTATCTRRQLLIPTNFVAESIQGGVRLTWVNQSQVATQIHVWRYGADGSGGSAAIATLPATAAAYEDLGAAAGSYTNMLDITDGVGTALGPAVSATVQ
jgi:hypothetical protein